MNNNFIIEHYASACLSRIVWDAAVLVYAVNLCIQRPARCVQRFDHLGLYAYSAFDVLILLQLAQDRTEPAYVGMTAAEKKRAKAKVLY
jgi:hypothetical protein